MVQTTESSQADSPSGEPDNGIKKHLTTDEREQLIYTLAEKGYAERFVDIPRYNLTENAKEKLEHNEAVVNDGLKQLYQTSLASLSPKEESLTLIQLNKAGVDLNVCPNYSIANGEENSPNSGFQPLETRCDAPITRNPSMEYHDCDVQLKHGPCRLLERLGDEEDKSWEQIVDELQEKNRQLREQYDGPTIIEP